LKYILWGERALKLILRTIVPRILCRDDLLRNVEKPKSISQAEKGEGWKRVISGTYSEDPVAEVSTDEKSAEAIRPSL